MAHQPRYGLAESEESGMHNQSQEELEFHSIESTLVLVSPWLRGHHASCKFWPLIQNFRHMHTKNTNACITKHECGHRISHRFMQNVLGAVLDELSSPPWKMSWRQHASTVPRHVASKIEFDPESNDVIKLVRAVRPSLEK